MGVYFRWRSEQDMYFFIEAWSILFSFLLIVVLGGIPYSGGFIFLELTAIMTSMLLKDFCRIRFLFFLFLVTVILAGVLQPVLRIEPALSSGQNLLFFVLLAVSFSAFMFQFNRTFWNQRLEAEQMKRRHLEEIDELKTRFYTNISHEFRTPLTVILGMARQIRLHPADRYREGTELIERNGRRLLRLVNQMLDLAKLESGGLSVHYQQADVALQLKYILESFHSLAADRNIQLDFHSEVAELLMDLDREKLEHIVGNLLANALKFTPAGGEVQLGVEVKPAGRDSNRGAPGIGQLLQIQVSDPGEGIGPEYLDHIFERFYQAGTATGEEKAVHTDGGIGIGLAIVKEYVQLLEGTISVESEPGAGTTFTIYLPIRRQAALETSAQSSVAKEDARAFRETGRAVERSTEVEKPTLLIVEDNPDVIRYLEILLRQDYDLLIAHNGREALEQALARIPDIIISDVMMPVMDGFQLLKRVKEDIRTSHIPVILLTAKADLPSRLEGLTRGADAYLAKPFNQEELAVRLKNLVESRKKIREHFADLHSLSLENKDSALQAEASFLLEVRQTLEEHLSEEDFGVPELCRAMNMSRSQLYRKFSALTDQSVGKFIRSLRLRRAKELLEITDLNVTEVAMEVGFRNLSHFSQSFTETFGINPSDVPRRSLS